MQGLLFLHCSFTKGRKTHWAAACKRENVLEFCLAVDLNTKFMVMSAEWHRQKDSLPSTLLLFRRDLSNRILADLLCPGGKEQFSWKERAISTCYERKRGREGERKREGGKGRKRKREIKKKKETSDFSSFSFLTTSYPLFIKKKRWRWGDWSCEARRSWQQNENPVFRLRRLDSIQICP